MKPKLKREETSSSGFTKQELLSMLAEMPKEDMDHSSEEESDQDQEDQNQQGDDESSEEEEL